MLVSTRRIHGTIFHAAPLLQTYEHQASQDFFALPLNLNHPIVSELESNPTPTKFSQIHALTITSSLFHSAFAASRLLKCLTDASNPPNLALTELTFSHIPDPDVFCYNLFIKALSLGPCPLKALSSYHRLLLQGLCPNEYTFCFLLDCCSHGLGLWEGRQVHAQLSKHGLDAATFSCTSLIHMYGDCGALSDALQAFEQMRLRSSISWAAMIDACVNHGQAGHGLRLFCEMRCLGVDPSNAALVGALCACARLGDLAAGRALHAYAVVRGLELNVTLGTSLIDMYSKGGAVNTAMEVFLLMPLRTVASWNCLIHGMAMNGEGAEAIAMFEKMHRDATMCPNGVTFLGVLRACCHSGLVEHGLQVFSDMGRTYGIRPGIEHYGCMVDLYARAGRIQEAMELIRTMPMKPDVGVWGALGVRCRAHGYGDMGKLLVGQIIKTAPCDVCGYLLFSETVAEEGRWDDVVGVRRVMREMEIRKVAGWSSVSDCFMQEDC